MVCCISVPGGTAGCLRTAYSSPRNALLQGSSGVELAETTVNLHDTWLGTWVRKNSFLCPRQFLLPRASAVAFRVFPQTPGLRLLSDLKHRRLMILFGPWSISLSGPSKVPFILLPYSLWFPSSSVPLLFTGNSYIFDFSLLFVFLKLHS